MVFDWIVDTFRVGALQPISSELKHLIGYGGDA